MAYGTSAIFETPDSAAPQNSLTTYFSTHDPACDNCRSKKIRCGRERPRCGNCRRNCVPCTFSGREKRHGSSKKERTPESNNVENRLMTLEKTLERLSETIESTFAQNPTTHDTNSPAVRIDIDNGRRGSTKTGGNVPVCFSNNGRMVKFHDEQRFFYGPLSSVAQCFDIQAGLAEYQSSTYLDTQSASRLEESLANLRSLCHLLAPHRPVDRSEIPVLLHQPPQHLLENAIKIFFDQSSHQEPLFHRRIFEAQISRSYHESSQSDDIALRICSYYILLQTKTWHGPSRADMLPISIGEIEDKSIEHLESFLYAAKVAVTRRDMHKCRVINTQALAAISLVALKSADLPLAELALNHGCAIAKKMRLHQLTYSNEEPSAYFEERQIVFWTLYTLDKTLSLTLGRTCGLPSFDCSTPLLSSFNDTLMEASYTPFLARIQLAGIQEQIYQKLFSADFERQNDEQRQESLIDLTKRLEAWWNVQDTAMTSHSDEKHSLGEADKNCLLYIYHSCHVIIQSRGGLPQTRREELAHARKSLACLHLLMAGHDKMQASGCVCYKVPFISFFTVLKHVLASCNTEDCALDLSLLQGTSNLMNTNSYTQSRDHPLPISCIAISTLVGIASNQMAYISPVVTQKTRYAAASRKLSLPKTSLSDTNQVGTIAAPDMYFTQAGSLAQPIATLVHSETELGMQPTPPVHPLDLNLSRPSHQHNMSLPSHSRETNSFSSGLDSLEDVEMAFFLPFEPVGELVNTSSENFTPTKAATADEMMRDPFPLAVPSSGQGSDRSWEIGLGTRW